MSPIPLVGTRKAERSLKQFFFLCRRSEEILPRVLELVNSGRHTGGTAVGSAEVLVSRIGRDRIPTDGLYFRK